MPAKTSQKFPSLHELSARATAFLNRHATLTAIAAGACIVTAGALVFWYEVFSGYAEPIQFIYAAF